MAEPREESRLDQRRFPAARGTVDQPDLEASVGVDLLDPALPELDAVRQSVSIARAGQEFQEEVGIMFIERSQPSWHNLDRPMAGIGLPGCGGSPSTSWRSSTRSQTPLRADAGDGPAEINAYSRFETSAFTRAVTKLSRAFKRRKRALNGWGCRALQA